MLALLPICQVRLVDVIVLRSQSMFAELTTDSAHYPVCSLYTLPKQLHVGRDVTGINKYSEIGNVSAVKMESVIQ